MELILKHSVRDFDAWKTVFDEHETTRAKYGALGHTIYRAADSPNDVTVVISWESRERADGFLKDPSLHEAMERGGVITEPSATWVDRVETTAYPAQQAA